jgi:phosphate transport system substrate-binding protein
MHFRSLVSCLGFLTLGLALHGDDDPRLKLAGSSTVARVLMPLKAGVEAAYGVVICLQPNGSGRGLADLAAGRVDAAMISGPIDFLLARVNAGTSTGLCIEQLEKLKLADTPKAEIVALLNPANPVRQLTSAQLRSILSGEIDNWSAVGGPNLTIQIVLPDELDGVRATIVTGLMSDAGFAPAARLVARTSDIIPLIAAEPGAVGVLPRGTLAADSVWAEIVPRFSVPLYIVARKDRLEENSKLEMVLNSLHSRAR